MKYRKLTNTGDYSFGANKKDYVEGTEAVAFAIRTRILLFYNEWWEDIGQGIPMFQSIVGQTNPDLVKRSIASLVEKRILEINEVSTVNSIDVEVNKRTRTISMSCNVTTTDGEVTEIEVVF